MKYIYRTYQLCIAAPLIIVATVLTALVTVIGSAIGGAHFWGYWPGRLWSKFVCRILLLPIEVRGMEQVDRRTSYVFVANHQGAFDIFLIYGYLGRNFKWMMKKELRRAPFIGKACAAARHIFVDNSGPKKIAETISRARQTLQNGTSLVVFPEGRRTFTGKMGPFKKGAYQLADELQLPVVPMTIDGSFEILPRMKGISFIERHKLRLIIHAPIPPVSQGQEDIRETMVHSREAINSALPERFKDAQ